MKSYRDLEIFSLSYELAIRVHEISLKLPRYELVEEGSQARRSSKAVTASIVEGYGRKRYKAEFIRFLTYAHASCDETVLHLKFMKDTHKIENTHFVEVIDSYGDLGRKISRFISFVERKWNRNDGANSDRVSAIPSETAVSQP